MALIIETGSLIPSAVSYVSVEETVAFASTRGVTLPETEAAVEILLIKAMDWLESMRGAYQGMKVSATQSLQWPRSGVTIDGFEVAEDIIPLDLKRAQMQVAMDVFAGLDPQVNYNGDPTVLREKVDVIETQYADPGAAGPVPYLRKALSFLTPLFQTSGLSSLTLTRV
jgi:hypothetical protein